MQTNTPNLLPEFWINYRRNLKSVALPVTCFTYFYIRPGSVLITFTITSSSLITDEDVQAFIDKNLLYNCKIVSNDTIGMEYQLVAGCESESNALVLLRCRELIKSDGNRFMSKIESKYVDFIKDVNIYF